MDKEKLKKVAKEMVISGKGLLAADESEKTCKKRFDSVGVDCTKETRREYRELLFSTPHASEFLSGVILFDETFHQDATPGTSFVQYLQSLGVIPGIKVDGGLIDFPGFPGEKITQGLDLLPEKMQDYHTQGAAFAKWRAVITVDEELPTQENISANSFILARYARICQDAGIVPIVEPEVLYDGSHTIERCEQVVATVFDRLFDIMRELRVYTPGVVLKTSMVLPGKESKTGMDHDDVAHRTVRVLHEHVPEDLGGVVFLSGGQTSRDAFINLNRIARKGPHPWGVTFSYSRALQDPVLRLWAKKRDARDEIQALFYNQLRMAGLASKGELDESELDTDTFVSKSQDM